MSFCFNRNSNKRLYKKFKESQCNQLLKIYSVNIWSNYKFLGRDVQRKKVRTVDLLRA